MRAPGPQRHAGAPPALGAQERIHIRNATLDADGGIVVIPNRAERRRQARLQRNHAPTRRERELEDERPHRIALAIATAGWGVGIRSMLGLPPAPTATEEVADVLVESNQQIEAELSRVLREAVDYEARARCQAMLPHFFGTPPAWVVAFVNGCDIETARDGAREESRRRDNR